MARMSNHSEVTGERSRPLLGFRFLLLPQQESQEVLKLKGAEQPLSCHHPYLGYTSPVSQRSPKKPALPPALPPAPLLSPPCPSYSLFSTLKEGHTFPDIYLPTELGSQPGFGPSALDNHWRPELNKCVWN